MLEIAGRLQGRRGRSPRMFLPGPSAPDVLTGADPENTVMTSRSRLALLMVDSHG